MKSVTASPKTQVAPGASPAGKRPDAYGNSSVRRNDNAVDLGLQFQPDDKGGVSARFRGNAGFQGYKGILHGGFISALLDAAMGSCLLHKGVEAVTVDLNVRFVEPVPYAAEVQVRGWVSEFDSLLYHTKARLQVGNRVMARAKATFIERRTAAKSGSKPPSLEQGGG